jgi:hypothetical protein
MFSRTVLLRCLGIHHLGQTSSFHRAQWSCVCQSKPRRLVRDIVWDSRGLARCAWAILGWFLNMLDGYTTSRSCTTAALIDLKGCVYVKSAMISDTLRPPEIALSYPILARASLVERVALPETHSTIVRSLGLVSRNRGSGKGS